MAKLNLSFQGVITKHSTEVKNGLVFKRLTIKCPDSGESFNIVKDVANWGQMSDPVSNLAKIANTDDDPYGKYTVPMDEYGICMNMTISGETIPVQFKSFAVSMKKKKTKDEDGQVFYKKVREAVLTFDKKQMDTDNKFDSSFLKYAETDPETGKDVIVPLEMEFEQCDPFNLFDLDSSEG